MVTVPAQYVEVPPPAQRRFGLFSVASPIDSSEPHWQNGIQWTSPACTTVQPVPTNPTDPCAVMPKTAQDIAPYYDGTPTVVYAMPTCAPFGVDLAKAAMDALAHGEEAAIGKALAKRVTLDGGAPSAGTGLTPAVALAQMEGYLASAGIAGFIGMDARVASLVSDKLEQHGNQLTTKLGTPVWLTYLDATGTGWVVATGRIIVYRAPASVHGPVQKMPEANQFIALAERPYVMGYECPMGKATATIVTP